MVIKDNEFLEGYLNFNLHYRYIVAEACLMSFDNGDWRIRKAIGIEIICQYVSLLEDIAMFYYAMKNKEADKSFLETLKKTFIKENNKADCSTGKIVRELNELENIGFDDFLTKVLRFLSKEDFKRIVPKELIQQFGGVANAYRTYKKELETALFKLKLAISNRIKDKKGQKFLLKDVLNRVKHGLLFLNDSTNQESIIFPINFKSINSNETEIEGPNLSCNNKATLTFLIEQMKIITEDFKIILSTYYRYHYLEK